MAKITVPNSQLYHWNQELNNMQHSIITLLLAGRIETFMKLNGQKLNQLNEAILRTQKKHLQLTDDNKLMFEEDGKTPKVLLGCRIEDYKKDMDMLMNNLTTVITN